MTSRIYTSIAALALLIIVVAFFLSRPAPAPPGESSHPVTSESIQSSPASSTPAAGTYILRGQPILSASGKVKLAEIEAEVQRQHDLLAEEGERKRKQEELERTPIPAPLPVALLEPDRSLAAGPEQQRAIESVRQRFLSAMAAAGDPSSAEYAEKWMAEQEQADELLHAYLGAEDFSKFRQEDRFGRQTKKTHALLR